MLSIIYIRFNKNEVGLYFDRLLKALPVKWQENALRYHQMNDKMRSVLGRHLIARQLIKEGYPIECLNDLKKDKYNRPFIDNKVDFNLAHSGEYVICALNTVGKIGIDIEKIQPVDLSEFSNSLHENENNKLKLNHKNLNSFYDIWVKKEAICKASGEGITESLNKIDTTLSKVNYSGSDWTCIKIQVNPNYVSYFATDEPITNCQIFEIEFKDLL
jgi:4'-phosphopantetheinyl transferase